MKNFNYKYLKSFILVLIISTGSCIKLPTENQEPELPQLKTLKDTTTYAYPCTLLVIGTDPDGDPLSFQFDISFNFSTSILSDWSSYVPCEQETSYLFQGEEGIYTIRVRSRDSMNELSNFSNNISVVFSNTSPFIQENPNGDTLLFVNRTGSFSSRGKDPENDPISFRFDPGNGDPYSEWSPFQSSFNDYLFTYTYSSPGIFNLRVQCKDTNNNISKWSNGLSVHVMSNIQLLGRCDVPGQADKIVVDGNYAYISSIGNGLQIADVSDPLNPVVVGGIGNYSSTNVCYNGNTIFLFESLGWRGFFYSINVSLPSNPILLDQIEINCPSNFHVEGNLAIIGTFVHPPQSDVTIILIDVTDPNLLTIISSATLGNASSLGKIFLRYPYAYRIVPAWNFCELLVIALSDINNPVLLANLEVNSFNLEEKAPIFVNPNGYLYLAAGAFLNIINILNPSDPKIVSKVNTEPENYDIHGFGNYLAIAHGSEGIELFDVTNPQKPNLIGKLDTQGLCKGVWCGSDYLYAADGTGGLLVFSYPSLSYSYTEKMNLKTKSIENPLINNNQLKIIPLSHSE